MRPKTILTALGVLASVALVAGLLGPGFARADRETGASARAGDAVVDDGVVRAGNAVVDEDGARIEGVPPAGEEEGGSDDEGTEEDNGVTPEDGEAVLRMRGDEGVAFSGTCSVDGEEREIRGQVPADFTFVLDGGELECEITNEGDGTLETVLVSGNDRVSQSVGGDSTIEFSLSGDGVSSSTSSSSSVSGSGSSSVVTQSSSSSSIVQSNSSSAGD